MALTSRFLPFTRLSLIARSGNRSAAQPCFLIHRLAGRMIRIAEVGAAFLPGNRIALSYHARHQIFHQGVNPRRGQRPQARHVRRGFFLQVDAPAARDRLGASEKIRHFTARAAAGDRFLEGGAVENGASKAWSFGLLSATAALAKGSMAGCATAEAPDLQARGDLVSLGRGGKRGEQGRHKSADEKCGGPGGLRP